jgi:prevent-host-death family protein
MMATVNSTTIQAIPVHALDPETQELIEQVRASRCPLVVTREGQPIVVLVEAAAFDQQQQRLALMERISQGEKDFADGRTHTQEEVEALLEQWLADGS